MSRPRPSGDRGLRKVEPPCITPSEEIEAQNYRAWQEWWATLTPDERVAMETMEHGKLAPPEPPRRRKRVRHQPEEEEFADGTCDDLTIEDLDSSETADVLDPCEALMAKEEREAAERPGTPLARFEIDDNTRRDLVLLGYVLPAIIDAVDPRLEASIIAIPLGLAARQGITVKALIERHGVQEEALADRARKWARDLEVCRASLGLLRLVISPILASRNPRLEAESIAMAARFGLVGGDSMTARGEHHGICRAAISTRVRTWVKRLGLALPRECKEQTANYLLFNVRKAKEKSFTE